MRILTLKGGKLVFRCIIIQAILNTTLEEQKSRQLLNGSALRPHWSIIKHAVVFSVYWTVLVWISACDCLTILVVMCKSSGAALLLERECRRLQFLTGVPFAFPVFFR